MRFTTTIAAAMVMAASQAKITIDPATRTFRDDQNRHVIMHGQNVVVKLPNYLPTTESFDWQTSISDEDLQLLQDWGTNIIRLGVMWESVETAPGVYDYDYLNSVDELINRFGAYGMNVIVDNHQDLFSRSLCGEGVPHFYTPEDLDRRCPNTILGFAFKMAGECKPFKYYDVPMGEDGLPVPEECTKRNFEDMYTMPEVASAFAALYDNKDGLLDKMMDFWSVVAEKYASNEHVIGYDIFNEPWPANLYREPSLFFKPGKFDHEKLFPLTVRAHETVRAKDDEKIIFVEPAQFPDTLPFLGGRIEHIGFKSTPGGEDYLNRQSLNDHSYCCQAQKDICDDGEPSLDKADACAEFHMRKSHTRSKDAKRLGVPLLFSEFGACFDTKACAAEINGATNAFDTELASWAYWMYKGFGDFTTTGGAKEGVFNSDGTPQYDKVKALTRSYVQAFQGEGASMRFDTNTGRFTANYFLDTSIQAPTVIYLNEDYWYSNGYKVTVDAENSSDNYTIRKHKNRLEIQFDENALSTKVSFTITAPNMKTQEYVNYGSTQAWYKVTDLAELNDVEDPMESWVNFYIENNLDNIGEGLLMKITGTDGKVIFQSQEDFRRAVAIAPAEDLMDAKVILYKNVFYLFEDIIMSIPIDNLNGHNVDIKLMDLMQ